MLRGHSFYSLLDGLVSWSSNVFDALLLSLKKHYSCMFDHTSYETKICGNDRWVVHSMVNFPIDILHPQVKYWGHMSPHPWGVYAYGSSSVWWQGGGIQSKGINSPRRGCMWNSRLWMIALHLTLADKTAANWWKCDILVKDQAQSVLCPMSGIVCIFCHCASIYVDSWLIVSLVSIGFGCSTCISEELSVVVWCIFAA